MCRDVALDASTDAFMHAVARASRGGHVDPAEYDRLLAALEAEKHELVEASLDGLISDLRPHSRESEPDQRPSCR